ncbi:MAG TPA: hypothetical protein VG166_00935 [Caulobacteraceae bacterium]|nr:hypothetical protein [Caulobacteraceae bacterium]
MSYRGTAAVLGVAAALAAAGAASAAVPSALFQDLRWRSIGPFRGGRVLAVEGDPRDARRFYFGAVNGEVWRTDDTGRTWTPIFDAAPVGSIGALAVAPSAPKVIYVGTGEADMRSDIAQGVGMFKTTDGGATWIGIGLADTQQIGKILVDPRDPNTVLVAALGHPYGPNAERGVFRSTDGGRTWTKTLFKDADTGAIDMAFQPDDPDVVYAALWQTRRPPWNVYPPSSGPGSGLYKSVDGGRTWTQLTGHGLPAAPGRIGIGLSDASARRVYALIDAVNGGGLYRSDDAGETWTKVSSDKRITERGWYFGGITLDPKDADRVWVCDTILLRSDDGGAHFLPIKGDPTGDDFHVLWIDPANPDRRILGVDQGALVTVNGGATWSSWYNQPTGQFYHVATDNRFPYRVYGAQQDSGAAAVPSRSDSPADGINMTQFHEVTAGGESDEIAPDPEDPDTVYGGRVTRLDLRSGQSRNVDPTLAFPDNYRGTWTLPLQFAKRDHALYFANQRIFSTLDGGAHWRPISPDLTRPNPGSPANLDAPTLADHESAGPRRGVVYDIGPSPLSAALIWAGTDDGLVWVTRDGGAHWRDVTPTGLAAWSKVGIVEPSHFDPDVAYIAVDRHRLDDFAPYIWRTRDGGRTWIPIVAGLADGGLLDTVNVVREDPVRPGLLYAGTERGVFVSFDDGANWQAMQAGLPRTSVRDFTVHGDDLVIATHGRGFFVMDDIAPLRALAADASPGDRLLPLAPAVRVHEPRFTGTPLPKDEPMAPNPPAGAYVDYIVGPGAADAPRKVTIAVRDAQGQSVNRFASTDVTPSLDLSIIGAAPEWIPVPVPPAATPGQHRFVWNLHYARPAALGQGDEGVWAPPGRYTVELTIGARSFRQPLEIIPDPRVKVTPAAFQAEFALARQIEQARLRVRAALADAAKLKAALKAKLEVASLERKSQFQALTDRLEVILPSGEAGGSHGLAVIATRLDSLAKAVDGADGAPTADDVTGFRLASHDLGETQTRLADLKQALAAAP